MVKNYIIRNELYHDEIHDENTFRQQKCVILEKQRQAHIDIKGERVKVIVKDSYYFIAYVDSDEKALEIASRWIQEDSQKEDNYSIHGIDHYYSVFD